MSMIKERRGQDASGWNEVFIACERAHVESCAGARKSQREFGREESLSSCGYAVHACAPMWACLQAKVFKTMFTGSPALHFSPPDPTLISLPFFPSSPLTESLEQAQRPTVKSQSNKFLWNGDGDGDVWISFRCLVTKESILGWNQLLILLQIFKIIRECTKYIFAYQD